MAGDYNLKYLGGLPLNMQIREQADGGTPTVVADPDSEISALYKDIARKVAIGIAKQSKDMTLKFPTIVVQNT